MDNADNNNCELWEMEWRGDNYYPQRDSHLDISLSLWDEVDHEDGMLCMFDQMTPVKDCLDFNYHVSGNDKCDSENTNEGPEECLVPKQLKIRRMLQFDSDVTDPFFCNEKIPSALLESKDGEDLMENTVPENMQCVENMQDIQSFSEHDRCIEDNRCTSGYEVFDRSPERFLATCFNETQMNFSPDEMNVSEPSYDHEVEILEPPIISLAMRPGPLQEPLTPAPHSIFKVVSGRKSYIRTPKLATSVAYPFALIKPIGVQGDVTLKDINQRIRILPPSKHKEKETTPYPTSAFSGKPVVIKTKIRTEGGKGSITIMRTKG